MVEIMNENLSKARFSQFAKTLSSYGAYHPTGAGFGKHGQSVGPNRESSMSARAEIVDFLERLKLDTVTFEDLLGDAGPNKMEKGDPGPLGSTGRSNPSPRGAARRWGH